MTPCETWGGKKEDGSLNHISRSKSCFQISTVFFSERCCKVGYTVFLLCAVSLKSQTDKVRPVVIDLRCLFCFSFSATCGSSRNLHCQRQEAANSGRRKLCVSARLAPVAPCLWGTSWVSERMNWVSGAMNDEKATTVVLPLNLALSLSSPLLLFCSSSLHPREWQLCANISSEITLGFHTSAERLVDFKWRMSKLWKIHGLESSFCIFIKGTYINIMVWNFPLGYLKDVCNVFAHAHGNA